MATLTLATTTTQVRPWPAGGTWNNVVVTNRVPQKSTTYGITLSPGAAHTALRALNRWINASGVGTHTRSAQEIMHGIGLEIQEAGALSTAQTGNGVTTNILDRGGTSGPATVVITTTIGATPTCTYLLESSLDGTAWAPQSYADSLTPNTFVTSTFVITTATTKTLIVAEEGWRYLRMTFSANVNVTNTVSARVG